MFPPPSVEKPVYIHVQTGFLFIYSGVHPEPQTAENAYYDLPSHRQNRYAGDKNTPYPSQ